MIKNRMIGIVLGVWLVVVLSLALSGVAKACTEGETWDYTGQTVCDAYGRWVNVRGGNIHGNSNVNPMAHPVVNPNLNQENNPYANPMADPWANPQADPDVPFGY